MELIGVFLRSEKNFTLIILIVCNNDTLCSIQALNEALQGDPNNAEWFCQRAYAHTLLRNYKCKIWYSPKLIYEIICLKIQ